LPSSPTRSSFVFLWAMFVVTVLAFSASWVSYPQAWLIDRQQGFAVAALCLWMVWRSRDSFTVRAGETQPLAAIGVLLFSLAWLFGWVLSIQLIHQGAVVAVLMFWLLAALGAGAFKAVVPIAMVWLLAVPIWGLLNPVLQGLTVLANSALLAVSGLEAQISGTFIAIEAGVFEVAKGCSGQNYLESGLLIGTVYALVFLKTWKIRGVAVGLMAAMALVSNWLRVFGLIVIGHYTEMQSPLIAEHNTYGWIIFAVVVLVYFMLARRIEAWDDAEVLKQEGISDRGRSNSAIPLGVAQRMSAVLPPTLAALVGPVAFWVLSETPNAPAPEDLRSSISPEADWTESRYSDSGIWRPGFQGADDHRTALWTRGTDSVWFDRLIYVSQRQGKELINAENRIVPDSLRLGGGVVGPIDSTGRMINATIVRTDEGGLRLVWHWYRVSGYDVHTAAEAKLLELVAFVFGAPPSELVALSTSCANTDERCERAAKTLFTFVTGTEPIR
jgi:exosortase